jgi:Family of unknown function (DUF5906)
MSSRRTLVEWWVMFGGHATASVIPYGSKSRTIPKELRGKCPGTMNRKTGLWSGTVGAVVGRFMTKAEARIGDEDGAAVGIYGDHFPGLDIDVEDRALADAIQALAFRILGPAPVRGRTGSVRRLLMYATDTRIRKIRAVIKAIGTEKAADDDFSVLVKTSAVELLGSGQYWNADGLHPSGQPYVWDQHPCDLGLHSLTVIDRALLDAFFTALADLVKTFGCTMSLQGAPAAREGSGGVRTGLDNPSLWAPTPEAVIDLLATYKPDVLAHDDFVRHMVAIKAALGSSREDYYPNVLEWAPGVRSTEGEATWKVWDSIHDAAIGWNWLIDRTGSPAGALVDFTDPPPDDAMPKDPAQSAIETIRQRWVFDTANDCFHDTQKVLDVSKDAFNIIHATGSAKLAQYGLAGKKTAAALCLNDRQFIKVDGSIYLPGGHDPTKSGLPLVVEGKRTLVNRWRPSDLQPKSGDPAPWLNLMDKLFPDETVRNHVLDYLAFVARNPGKKIGHAMIWYSQEQGVGKDTALDPLLHIVGMHNVARIDPDDLTGPFNDYLGKQVIICNEMMNFERSSVYNRLKSYLEISNKLIIVNPKYRKKYETRNIHIWIFCTNHPNAISLEVGDRRLFVCECPSEVFAGTPVDELYAWYDQGGREIVFGYLLERDISHFNPAHPPPVTAAKLAMIELAKSPVERWLDDAFGHRRFVTVAEIRSAAIYDSSPGVHTAIMKGEDFRIIKWLKTNKFEALRNRIRIEGGDPTTVWARTPTPEIRVATGQLLAQRVAADIKTRR